MNGIIDSSVRPIAGDRPEPQALIELRVLRAALLVTLMCVPQLETVRVAVSQESSENTKIRTDLRVAARINEAMWTVGLLFANPS
jgi:hypothetical protein